MARKVQEDLSDNEIDAFEAGKEQVLLEEAGNYLNRGTRSDDEDSEEEVLGFTQRDDSDEEGSDEEDEEGEEGEESGEEGWGSKKNYYGGDDVSDDEAGKEMADEALRQQKKHLQELDMDDFVDEDMMEDWKKTAAEYDTTETKSIVVDEEMADLDSLDDTEKLTYLNGSFPEFVPLLKEFNILAPKLEQLQRSQSNALVHTKAVALTAYMSSISSYFALFVENLRNQDRFTTMKEDPVMESILSCREVWRQANELSLVAREEEVDEIEVDEIEVDDAEVDHRVLTDSEEEDVLEEEVEEEEVDIDVTSKRAIRKTKAVASGDFTETATPESVDMEEKERRKKSLRFYTSKIDQAAKKSDRSDKFTGDLDIPYKERLFERQQRLIEEARKKGLGLDKDLLGDALDNEDIGSGDENVAREINENADDYYESIKLAKTDKKNARRAAHDDAKKAARDGRLAELQEHTGEDGKRALNFQILKNKGLTPHRGNENRNARVKKRKRYEEAKKKLKSVRQVYDDSNRGPYQGEKTGIKKGLSRSVKLV